MTDALTRFLFLAALTATLAYCAFVHESQCPGCPLSVAADFPSVAMLDGPPVLRSER